MTSQTSALCQDLPGQLKRVLRYLPAPVGVVTSHDPDTGTPVGLAMSAIMPVALDPCSMAVAVNRAGSSHEAILRAGEFCINLLDPASHHHLQPFAGSSRRDERFAGPDWAQRGKAWYITSAAASIFCQVRHVLSHGTHDLLVGDVTGLVSSDTTEILGWADGRMGLLGALLVK